VGDDNSMRRTVQAALDNGVRIGAHPSYPDRTGFGRRPMEMGADELRRSLQAQVDALRSVARSCGTRVESVKAHGALYGEVARGGDACAALLDVVASVCDPGTTLVLPAGAPARVAAGRVGVPVLDEGFCDRAYGPDAALVGRQHDGAVYDDPALAAAQALALATEGTVVAVDGTVLPVHVDTLCLHGDSPNALAMARAVRAALTGAGITIAAPPRP
jgi:UPF0271 protein